MTAWLLVCAVLATTASRMALQLHRRHTRHRNSRLFDQHLADWRPLWRPRHVHLLTRQDIA